MALDSKIKLKNAVFQAISLEQRILCQFEGHHVKVQLEIHSLRKKIFNLKKFFLRRFAPIWMKISVKGNYTTLISFLTLFLQFGHLVELESKIKQKMTFSGYWKVISIEQRILSKFRGQKIKVQLKIHSLRNKNFSVKNFICLV